MPSSPPNPQLAKLLGAGYQRPELAGLFSGFRIDVPQLDADLDRTKAKTQGVCSPVKVIHIVLTVASNWYRKAWMPNVCRPRLTR